MRIRFGGNFVASVLAVGLLSAQQPAADPLDQATATADGLTQRGRYSEAAEVLKPAVRAAEKARPSHRLAVALALLGTIYQYQYRYTESERMLRRALGIWERDPLSDPQWRLGTAVRLASLYSGTGRYALSERLVSQHLSIWRNLSTCSLQIAGLFHELGYAQGGQRRFAEAETSYREALAILQKLTEHEDDLATVLTTLGNFQARLGRYDEALENLERAVAIYSRLHSEARPEPVEPLLCLARVHVKIGRPLDAERVFKQALAAALRSIGSEHPLAGVVKVEYARVLRILGRRRDSATMEREGKAILERSSLMETGRYTIDVGELLENRRRR